MTTIRFRCYRINGAANCLVLAPPNVDHYTTWHHIVGAICHLYMFPLLASAHCSNHSLHPHCSNAFGQSIQCTGAHLYTSANYNTLGQLLACRYCDFGLDSHHCIALLPQREQLFAPKWRMIKWPAAISGATLELEPQHSLYGQNGSQSLQPPAATTTCQHLLQPHTNTH